MKLFKIKKGRTTNRLFSYDWKTLTNDLSKGVLIILNPRISSACEFENLNIWEFVSRKGGKVFALVGWEGIEEFEGVFSLFLRVFKFS